MKYIYTEEELPQRSEKWLELRKPRIGGSDVATILGLMSKYEKPVTLWKRKTGKLKPKSNNKWMTRGQEMEEAARYAVKLHYSEVEGIKNPEIVPYFAIHSKHEDIAVSFDGVDLKNKFITELKCPNFISVFKSVFQNGIQDYYYPQVQLQLAVANDHWGITKGYFCSYYPDGAYILNMLEFKEVLKYLAVIDIDYDPNYFQEMVKVIKKFNSFVEREYWDDEEYQETINIFTKNTSELI